MVSRAGDRIVAAVKAGAVEPTGPPPQRVAVMQPYFFPYAGYYRLLAAADLFLIFDCVQFARRGRVHRCEVPGPSGRGEWLTLPLQAAPRDTAIAGIRLAADARARFDARLRRLPWIEGAGGPNAARVRAWLQAPLDGWALADYLESTLRETAALLGLHARIARSSALALAPHLRGAARVIAAVQAVGGSGLVNAPGGVGLYDGAEFAAAGLTLEFLTPYEGRFRHMLPALLQRPAHEIAEDIRATAALIRA